MPEPIVSEVAAPMGETYDVDALLSSFLSAPGEKKPAPKSEEKPAPKAEEKKPEEPAKPKHSKGMIRLGRSLGFTDAEMDAMAEEDLADELVGRQAHVAAEAKAKPAPKAEEKPAEWEPDFGDVDLSEVDDNIVKAMKKLAKDNHALRTQLTAKAEEETHRARVTMSERLDGLFSAHPDMFGSGPSAKISARSKEAARRGSVLHQMDRIAKLNGRADPEADFAAACEQIGFELKAAPKEEADAEAQRWAKAGLARPQSRRDEPVPKGEARAEAAAEAALERGGYTVGSDKTTRLEDFPD